MTVVTDGAHNNETEADGRFPSDDFSPLKDPTLPISRGVSSFASGPVSLPVMRSSAPHFTQPARKKPEDTLCCPKCSQGFSEEEQDKLLEHMEICCE